MVQAACRHGRRPCRVECGIVGAAIAAIAAAALSAFHEAEGWISLVVGFWVMIAPRALGFSAVTAAIWAQVIAGIAVAGGSVWFVRNRPISTA